MAVRSVDFPSDLDSFIQKQAQVGQFTSGEEYLLDLVARERKRIELLHALLDEPLAEMERGEGIEWNPEQGRRLFEDMLRKASSKKQ